jgi:hypothetical protein
MGTDDGGKMLTLTEQRMFHMKMCTQRIILLCVHI